jgi:hypothetical protein
MKYIKIIIFVFFIGSAYSQTKNFIDRPYLETGAKVDTLVIPDRIFLSILISEKDTKGRTSVEDLEVMMASKLTSIGINVKEQLSLNDLSSNFKHFFIKKSDVLKTKQYTLLVNDAETAGRVIMSLEAIDISNVSVFKTEYSKGDELLLYLKQKAIIKAKLNAETLLKPLGQVLGKALFVSDTNSINELNLSQQLQGRASGVRIRGVNSIKSESSQLEIEFDKIRYESSVSVIFEIE